MEGESFLETLRAEYQKKLREEDSKPPLDKRNLTKGLDEFLSNVDIESTKDVLIKVRENTEKILDKISEPRLSPKIPPGKAVLYINADPNLFKYGQEELEIEKIVNIFAELNITKIQIKNTAQDENYEEYQDYTFDDDEF